MSFNGSGTFLINTAGQPVVSGTVISSTAFNALTADLATGLSTCLTKDGQTTPTANIPMGNNKLTGLAVGTDATDASTLAQVQSTVVKLIGSVSGTNTITGSLTPALAAYAAGQMFYFVAAGDNTGAVTLNVNSLGAKNVTKNGTTALSAGDIKSGQTVAVIYDGTRFQVIGTGGLTGTTDNDKTTLGINAGDSITSGAYNTALGYDAGTALTTGGTSTAVGAFAVKSATTANHNTGVGYNAILYPTGASNTALGSFAMQGASGSTAAENVAIGNYAMEVVTTAGACTVIGYQAGDSITTGSWNTLIGHSSGNAVTTSVSNTAVGYNTLRNVTTSNNNTALGDSAYQTGNYSNSSCIGYSSAVTGNNQVQLGNSGTTTYAYGAVQDRSDARDKADIQSTDLGLNFIMALQPRKFRWDMREDYRPPMPGPDATKEEWAAYSEACKLENLTHDGTHKRNRFHQGLIAQEVKATMDAMGVDFGGYQDHKINGGQDVLTIGYEEMIAPLIKAIQELKAEFDAYKATHP
jgi:hypothetical protein